MSGRVFLSGAHLVLPDRIEAGRTLVIEAGRITEIVTGPREVGAGETRVLFGTDVPFHHPVVEIAKVRVSGLDDVGMERVLNKNGRLLFFGAEDAEAPV